MNIQEPALGWPSVNESSIGIMGGSGSNPNLGKDQPSGSASPSDETGKRCHILIVEDNAADVFLIREALKSANLSADLDVVKDGEQAVRFFDDADSHDAASSPVLVILDINLPKKQGDEVLQHLRKSRRCGNALVLVVSTSASRRDQENMANLGANGYFHKPSDYAEFMKLGEIVKQLLNSGSAPAPAPPKES